MSGNVKHKTLMSKLFQRSSDITNTRNIPEVAFIDNVSEWVDNYTSELIVDYLTQYWNKYKYMKSQINQHIEKIKDKIPGVEKTLEAINYLEKKQKGSTVNVDYMISNNLWGKAELTVTDSVYVWLGADVMCEYSLNEAKDMLNKNLSNANSIIKNDMEDLRFITDQITICEVNLARVYNEDVKRKQAQEKKSGVVKK